MVQWSRWDRRSARSIISFLFKRTPTFSVQAFSTSRRSAGATMQMGSCSIKDDINCDTSCWGARRHICVQQKVAPLSRQRLLFLEPTLRWRNHSNRSWNIVFATICFLFFFLRSLSAPGQPSWDEMIQSWCSFFSSSHDARSSKALQEDKPAGCKLFSHGIHHCSQQQWQHCSRDSK